ncbi:sigma-70 family RNA polymerase sigma factor [Streptomyces sp. NPDC093707]|uniref:RNA polymerase sigma factor n=1 Tax=Streptomyces sp. NPDC093707 TaxID=3154984 RepID=UPI00344FAEB6
MDNAQDANCPAEAAHNRISEHSELDALDDLLVERSYRIMCAWISDRSIFRRLQQIGPFRLPCLALCNDPDVVGEIAGLTVAVALKKFRNNIGGRHGWDPSQGSTLSTFFIGQCLLCFPNEYRRWLRENRSLQFRDASPDEIENSLSAYNNDPEFIVMKRLAIHGILSTVDERTRLALIAYAIGYPQRDIATILKITPKAVETLIYRARSRIRHEFHMSQ